MRHSDLDRILPADLVVVELVPVVRNVPSGNRRLALLVQERHVDARVGRAVGQLVAQPIGDLRIGGRLGRQGLIGRSAVRVSSLFVALRRAIMPMSREGEIDMQASTAAMRMRSYFGPPELIV